MKTLDNLVRYFAARRKMAEDTERKEIEDRKAVLADFTQRTRDKLCAVGYKETDIWLRAPDWEWNATYMVSPKFDLILVKMYATTALVIEAI